MRIIKESKRNSRFSASKGKDAILNPARMGMGKDTNYIADLLIKDNKLPGI